MKKKKKHVQHGSILNHLIVLFIVFSLIPVILISWIINNKNYNIIWHNTAYSTTQLSEQLLGSISQLLTDAEYFQGLSNESCVREFLTHADIAEGGYEDIKKILNSFNVFLGNIRSGRYVNNIYLINPFNQSVCDRYGVNQIHISDLKKIQQEKLVNMVHGKMVTVGNLNPHPRYKDEQFVYIGMPLVIPPLLESNGIVLVEMKSSVFEDIFSSVRLSKTGTFSVVSQTGSVLFGGELSQHDALSYLSKIKTHMEQNFTDKVGGENTLVVWHCIPQTDWTLIGHIAIKDLMRDANQFTKTVWVVTLSLAVSSVLMYIFFSNRMLLPLRQLKATMKMAEMGDKNVRYQENACEEINDVGESFNSMMARLNQMTKRDMMRQSNLQKAELDLMQAQINPHFLYNTLDAILWEAKVGDTNQVINTVDALSSFFRTTLSKGSSWISVHEELQMVRNYLIIQKARYGEKLHSEIQVDPGLGHHKILKLTLQPLVENAIYHGIKSCPEGGTVRVTAREEGKYLIFTVSDDGIGMSPEVLRTLQDNMNCAPSSIYDYSDGGFGLRNVHSRVRLYYGDDCGLTISSSLGVGTSVCVKIRKEVTHV